MIIDKKKDFIIYNSGMKLTGRIKKIYISILYKCISAEKINNL